MDWTESTAETLSDRVENLQKSDAAKTRPRSARSAGRPRLDEPGVAILSKARRVQIRRAQQTYRQKKEAIFQTNSARVAELEARIHELDDAFGSVRNTMQQSELNNTHPVLFMQLERIESLLNQHHQPSTPSKPSQSNASSIKDRETNDFVFGYQLGGDSSNKRLDTPIELGETHYRSSRAKPPRPFSDTSRKAEQLPRIFQDPPDFRSMLGVNTYYSYWFQEPIVSRRLQRFCLEHTFNLWVDPRTHPAAIYNVFRLVPCIQDKAKMRPYFERLVRGGVNDPLEIPSLPFYSIGGAGTHYPAVDESGNRILPSNTRLPRRVLGILPAVETGDGATATEDRQNYLEIFGYGGQWFDCKDVEGYLRDQGVDLENSSLYASLNVATAHSISPNTNMHGLTQPYEGARESVSFLGGYQLSNRSSEDFLPSSIENGIVFEPGCGRGRY